MVMVLVASQAADLTLTLMLSLVMGGSSVEANPLARAIWDSTGVLGVVAYKVAAIGGLLAVIGWVDQHWFTAALAWFSFLFLVAQVIVLGVML